MTRFIYTLLSYIFLPFAILKLVKNRKSNRLSERLGFFKPIEDEIIWIHCVSVGEFLAAKVLIDKLLKNNKILITTTTKTASTEVINSYKDKVYHLYFPFDCPIIIRKYLSNLKLKMVLIMETEIWANLINTLNKKQIPCIIINARLSEKSFKKYQKFAKLTKQTLNKLSLILTQDKNSENRFIKLGLNSNKIKTFGNIKFDQVNNLETSLVNLDVENITKNIVVFASTHESEEEEILNAYLKIKKNLDIFLIIIPRHPERFNDVFELIKNKGLSACKRSENTIHPSCEVLLGDSMGEMMGYFNLADVVFMGGSLNNTGGHNMLEPASIGKSILFGKNVFNFAQISSEMLAKNAAKQVKDADELFQEIKKLLVTKKQLRIMGDNAKKYFNSQQNITKNILTTIEKYNY